MIINSAAPNTDTGSPLTVGATESPAAVAMTESPLDVGVTGSRAPVAVEVDPVPTTEWPMVVGATESPAAVDVRIHGTANPLGGSDRSYLLRHLRHSRCRCRFFSK